ncbi:MAG: glycosyltransferase [Candidatus Sungbacteria bacterium]|nr:glycosyltransferase [Candidatus Sungbacteria bacterium]
MKPITISIVTPTYNQARFIGQTVESILSQEGDFYIDYIIVNDGSTDNTLEVIEKYDKLMKTGKYPIKCKEISYRYWTRPNGGQTSAINEGLKAAKGSVLAWMNSDDYYMPGVFEKVAKVFTDDAELDFLYGDSLKIFEDGRPPKAEPKPRPDETFESLRTRGNSFGFNFFSKKIIDKVGYLDESFRYCMDLELWHRIFQSGKVKYIPGTIGAFRVWEGSKTTTQQKKFAEERRIIAERYGGNIISPHSIYALRSRAAFTLNAFQRKTPHLYETCKKALYAAVDRLKYTVK